MIRFIDKPESKSQFPGQSPKSNGKGKEEFGLWAVTKILEATHPNHNPKLLSMMEISNEKTQRVK